MQRLPGTGRFLAVSLQPWNCLRSCLRPWLDPELTTDPGSLAWPPPMALGMPFQVTPTSASSMGLGQRLGRNLWIASSWSLKWVYHISLATPLFSGESHKLMHSGVGPPSNMPNSFPLRFFSGILFPWICAQYPLVSHSTCSIVTTSEKCSLILGPQYSKLHLLSDLLILLHFSL